MIESERLQILAEESYAVWCRHCAKNGLPIECGKELWVKEFLLVMAIEATEPVIDLSEYEFGHSTMSSSQWAATNLIASGVGE